MTINPTKKRTYDSKRRKQLADQTRRQILEAARKLFIKQGYWGTSIDAIAESAGVAPETVYAIFGSKREVLHQLIDVSIGGDEKKVRLIDRPEPQAVLHEKDALHLISDFSEGITTISSRAAPIMAILAEAAKNEPKLAALQARLRSERLENMGLVAAALGKLSPLRMEVQQAAETIWGLTSPELFTLLMESGGWTKEHYSSWLRDTLIRLLIRE